MRPCGNVFCETVADDTKTQVPTSQVADQCDDLRIDLGEGRRFGADPLVAQALQDNIGRLAAEARRDVVERRAERYASDRHGGTNRFPLPAERLAIASQIGSQ